MSAAHNFKKERHVSGAHENDERTKGLENANFVSWLLEVRFKIRKSLL